MSASPSTPRLNDCTGVQSQRVFRARCRWASRASTATPGWSERDIHGYTGVRVPEELMVLRANWIAQMASIAAGGRSILSSAVGDYSPRPSFTPFVGFGGGRLRTPSHFPERPASSRSAAPTYRGSEETLFNEYENDRDIGSGSDGQ
ncbi:unnamed protein product [Phytophthora fragariaefolia]|uniref:Unnamed protein product n=1 Tax=Phytophthora fragariaefolia TaxID=1490495 RepID=A0A9W6TK90_9STRA|nr:unnamed protein product [Phytophthora fragariaefolia]